MPITKSLSAEALAGQLVDIKVIEPNNCWTQARKCSAATISAAQNRHEAEQK